VKSICGQLGPDVRAGSSIEEVEEYLDPGSDSKLDPWNNPSRVINNDGDLVGILWFEDWCDLESESTVDDALQRLEPNEYLSSATTILEAVELFSAKRNAYFCVIYVNEVVGILRYADLFCPLGRLAFFALALEIEDQALRLCQSASIRERCWLSISDNRKRKAIALFKLRYGREPKPAQGASFLEITALIECTNLVDKATMIWKQQLVTPATRTDVLGFFNDLKKIRDRCAHPGGEGALFSRERLPRFINSAKCMRNSLRESMQSHGGGSRLLDNLS
jgi:hypothetical protein